MFDHIKGIYIDGHDVIEYFTLGNWIFYRGNTPPPCAGGLTQFAVENSGASKHPCAHLPYSGLFSLGANFPNGLATRENLFWAAATFALNSAWRILVVRASLSPVAGLE